MKTFSKPALQVKPFCALFLAYSAFGIVRDLLVQKHRFAGANVTNGQLDKIMPRYSIPWDYVWRVQFTSTFQRLDRGKITTE